MFFMQSTAVQNYWTLPFPLTNQYSSGYRYFFLNMDILRVCSSCLIKRYSMRSSSRLFFNHFSGRRLIKRQITQQRFYCSTQFSGQTTVDEDEVIKLSKSGSDWWDVYGEFHALHSMNKVRVPYIKTVILGNLDSYTSNPGAPLKGLKILDIGCGGGLLSEALARLGADVKGIDASARNTHVAMRHASHDPLLPKRLSYECITVEELAHREQEVFDCVVTSEVIEHITEKESFISALSNLLKPGASLVITTLGRTTKAYLAAIVAAEYLTRMVTPGTHEWDKFITAEDLKKLLERFNLETKNIQGLCYNPINYNWSLIDDSSVNYALHAVRMPSVTQDEKQEDTNT